MNGSEVIKIYILQESCVIKVEKKEIKTNDKPEGKMMEIKVRILKIME